VRRVRHSLRLFGVILMAERCMISEELVPLIGQRDVSLQTIVIVGEMIAAEARILDFPWTVRNCKTGEELGKALETHEGLVRRTQMAVSEFLQTRDREVLMQVLSDIKSRLTEFEFSA